MSWLLIALGLLLVPTRLPAAQETRSQARRGLWFGGGAGWGSANFTCSACGSERFGGVVAYINAGKTLSPQALLGAEFNGWINSENGLRQQMTFLSLVGVLYPQVASGFFLRGGFGAMWFLGETGIDDLTATAPAFVVGTGYEFSIGYGWYVAPVFNWRFTTGATFELDGQSLGDEDFRFNQFEIGVGFKRP